MKKKRWILLTGLIVITVVGFSLVSHAGRNFPNPMGLGPMYRFNLMSEELGLTDDQRAALMGIFKSHRQEIMPLAKTMIAKKKALGELMLAENPDPAAIRRASTDLGQAIGEAAIFGSALFQKAQTILTPEQLTRFREMRQNRQKAFDESLREWQERGPGF